jgi:hypothetical protein
MPCRSEDRQRAIHRGIHNFRQLIATLLMGILVVFYDDIGWRADAHWVCRGARCSRTAYRSPSPTWSSWKPGPRQARPLSRLWCTDRHSSIGRSLIRRPRHRAIPKVLAVVWTISGRHVVRHSSSLSVDNLTGCATQPRQ